MPGISVSKTCIPFGGGISWQTYWATRIPSALVLTALSPTSIKLDWTANGVQDYDGYSIERSGDGVDYTEIDTVAIGTETFTDSGLTHGTAYYYRIRAYKGVNYSDYVSVIGETIYLPTDIAGLNYWHDISQLTGYSDNDEITAILDYSGNGYNVTSNGGAGKRGVYKTNVLSGKPSARFDGVDDYNRMSGSMAIPDVKTVFIVANIISGTDANIVDYYNNGATISRISGYLNIKASVDFSMDTPVIANGTPFIVTGVFNDYDSLLSCNGGNTKAGSVQTDPSDAIWYGRNRTASRFTNYDLFDSLCYSGALTSSARRRVEKYLAWKYGIALVPIQIASVFLHTEASTIYVSPDGTGDGSTETTPTSLENAIRSKNVIAGDTIMLLDGTYLGTFIVKVTGTSEDKITIRSQNMYGAVIDGSYIVGDGNGLGQYTVSRNIRFMNSETNRGTWESEQNAENIPPDVTRIMAENAYVINSIIHDGGLGMGHQQLSDNGVVYGNIFFNNGWADNVLGGAQNIYWQGAGKTIKHNIFGGAFKRSFAGYGTSAFIEDCTVEENVIFARSSALIGATHNYANNIKFNENHVIGEGNTIQMGYNYKYNGSLECKRNRTYGGSYFAFQYWNSIEASNNIFVQGEDVAAHGFCFMDDRNPSAYNWNFYNNKYHYLGTTPSVAFKVEYGEDYFGRDGWGSWAEWNAAGYDTDGSTYDEIKPTENEVFVYPNEYPDADDKRMGIVVIWNWEEEETVEVDLTDLGLQVGTTYRWRQAQDPLVDIDTWECAGDTYTFAMTGHTVAKPIGFDEELIPTQFPIFGCFIIEKV